MIKYTLDHILLGINDLEKGILEFEEKTGIRPVFGGHHPQYGTHNALVSLGNKSYLEIIAPIEQGKKPTGPFRGFEKMDALSPYGWVIGTSDLNNILANLENQQIGNTGINQGSRSTPDGNMLHWKTIFLTKGERTLVNPFFIQWDSGSIHPSRSTPKGIAMDEFIISSGGDHPFISFLMNFSIEMIFSTDHHQPAGNLVKVSLLTPKGIVVFDQDQSI